MVTLRYTIEPSHRTVLRDWHCSKVSAEPLALELLILRILISSVTRHFTFPPSSSSHFPRFHTTKPLMIIHQIYAIRCLWKRSEEMRQTTNNSHVSVYASLISYCLLIIFYLTWMKAIRRDRRLTPRLKCIIPFFWVITRREVVWNWSFGTTYRPLSSRVKSARIDNSETSVLNHLTPRINPEDGRI